MHLIDQEEALLDGVEGAGGYLMSDSYPTPSRVYPDGVKVAATDSCKQAHYLPATRGLALSRTASMPRPQVAGRAGSNERQQHHDKAVLVAVVMRVPTMTSLDQDTLEVMEDDDWIKEDTGNGIVEITRNASG